MKVSKKPGTQTAVRLRCGTPDCKWSVTSPDLREEHVKYCYSRFREHCIDRHDLDEDDTETYFFFNFEQLTLTLLKGSEGLSSDR